MALQYIGNARAAIGSDAATNERGFLVKFVNRTGHASVKGELVAASPSADNEVVLQSAEYDTIGVVQEAGIAEGSEMWVWINGSVCEVLYKENTASTRGYVLLADAVDGRASDIAVFGAGLAAVDQHFKECGHVLKSIAAGGAGVSNLVLCSIHFN
jgi:uncharacterized membrane protein